MKVLYTFDVQSLDIVFVTLFGSKVQPVLPYASEIWGLDGDRNQTEKKQMFAFKRFLGVGRRTSHNMIYVDTGRYPLYIHTYVRTIRYWIKITRMKVNRVHVKAYLMLLHFDKQGKKNLVTKVRLALLRYGFGYVWENNGV